MDLTRSEFTSASREHSLSKKRVERKFSPFVFTLVPKEGTVKYASHLMS